MEFQNQNFISRHKTSEFETLQIMETLKKTGVITDFLKTEVETDKAGIDFYVQLVNENEQAPIQFKTRRDKWRDFPVCRFQPFRGYTRSTLGRDYRSLKEHKNKFYFVASSGNGASFDRVTITKTEKILTLIEEAEREWFGSEEPWSYFTEAIYNQNLGKRIYNKKLKVASNGVEAWFKKNLNNVETFGKINLYIPDSYADQIIDIR